MALEKDVDCPACGETRSFYRTAAMTLHLGEKTKWRCPDCGYGFVEIDGIDTLPPCARRFPLSLPSHPPQHSLPPRPSPIA